MGEQINLGFVNDSGDTNTVESPRTEVGLQRKLGLFSGVSLIVGNIFECSWSVHKPVNHVHCAGIIVGSGIWVTPGFIMTYSESVGIYLIQWAICGFISTLGEHRLVQQIQKLWLCRSYVLPRACLCSAPVRRWDCIPEGWAGGLYVILVQLVERGGARTYQVLRIQ